MWITIDRLSSLSLSRQIYEQIRQLILTEALIAGNTLPSTRALAGELSVSRNTIIEAYSQLIAEGYLETRQGSGTVVAEGIYIPAAMAVHSQIEPTVQKNKLPKPLIDFRTGIPALEHFPKKEWGNLYREQCNTIPPSGFAYNETVGLESLRTAIAHYLFRARGLSCNPKQIIITSGSTQGLSLISHILKDNNKKVLVENPSHGGLRKVITTAGCRLEGIDVDEKGLKTDQLDLKTNISFIYTTPSHQHPLGGILPVQRRLKLIEFAEKNDTYIIEDDYDSEFRYEGHPIRPLYELNSERVIYLGSFSKILAPALRLGFMIVPEKLFSSCKNLKAHTDVHSATVEQYTLANFIEKGFFEKHLWKMKKYYGRNRNHLLHTLQSHFGSRFNVLGHASGLHMAVQFKDVTFTKKITGEIAQEGVLIYPADNFYLHKQKKSTTDKIILGYSHLSADDITKGIATVSSVLCKQ